MQDWPGHQVLPRQQSAGLAAEPHAHFIKEQMATAKRCDWAEAVTPLGTGCAPALHLSHEPADKPSIPGEPKSKRQAATCSPRLVLELKRSQHCWKSRGPCLSPPSLVALLPRREPDLASRALGN